MQVKPMCSVVFEFITSGRDDRRMSNDLDPMQPCWSRTVSSIVFALDTASLLNPFGKLLGTKLKGLESTGNCGGSSRRHLG